MRWVRGLDSDFFLLSFTGLPFAWIASNVEQLVPMPDLIGLVKRVTGNN
ncbi:MAG: hypothetical protein JWQ71_2847 [Pedosphaera sp.]|nr:hypothetical protein [Pedosphaera sp.]